ncbi:MAG: hypothetical protein EOM68_27085 [Spirochaetia bacterium]|nr:hypothetical protein [Spirochaetia bacterium]
MEHATFTKIQLKTLELKEIQLAPLPEALQSQQVKTRSSAQVLPKFSVKLNTNLIDEQATQKSEKRENKVETQVIGDIFGKTQLRSDKVVKEAVEGKKVFGYSQQTLNKQRIRNRVQLKENRGVLRKNIDIEY